ncbi:MAG: transposase [Flavobacteriaceae bacterium]|nr:transposase [Flavobacteriaceae bacterium]
MTLEDIYNQFPTKTDCINYLEKLRWVNKPICPYCNSNNFTQLKEENRYHCNTCNTSYSVTVETMFHKTKIDLQKWFYSIHLIINHPNIITARFLAKKINTTKDTAWRIIKEVKNSLIKQDDLVNKISKDEKRFNT